MKNAPLYSLMVKDIPSQKEGIEKLNVLLKEVSYGQCISEFFDLVRKDLKFKNDCVIIQHSTSEDKIDKSY